MSYDDDQYDDPDVEPELSDAMQALVDEAEEDLDPYRYAFNDPMSFDALEELIGRAPSKEEQLHLLKLQKQLNIGNDDALWYLLIALQYHLILYRDIPREIEQTSYDVIKLALSEIRKDTDEQLWSISEEAMKQRAELTADLQKVFKEMSSQLDKSVVKLVSKEIAKTSKQSHWAYVWGSVSAVLTVLLGVTMAIAMLRPDVFGG